MKKCEWLAGVFLLTVVILPLTGFAQIVFDPPKKKLTEFGWNSPFLQQYQRNMKLYENGPFDGITLKLSMKSGNGYIFKVDDWAKVSEETKTEEEAVASAIKKSKILTDNFLVLYGASQMDWFSDEDWALAEDHIRFAVRMAIKAHCKGILWDPEPYGDNPWLYSEQERCKEFSFEAYHQQVRKRGGQFMKLLQETFPGLKIFSLREISDFQQGSPFSAGLLPVANKANTVKSMEWGYWGLHIAFYVGMLDAIEPGTVFIDGNEDAYYYTSALEYYKIRHTLMDDAKAFIPPELRFKHSSFARLGHAISMDYIAGNWLKLSAFPKRLTGQGLMMTPEQRCQWFEHNAYYAMRSSDEYAWLYTESTNWWTDSHVPEGFKQALVRAKQKVNAGAPLGFVIEPMIHEAQEKAEAYYNKEASTP